MKDKRNNSIDIFRLVCALLVVAIHTHPFADINEYVGYFCTSVLTRIAVPFFFCVSGYYYVEKLEKIGLRAFKDTSKKILKIYIVWSIIYSVINVIQYINSGANING